MEITNITINKTIKLTNWNKINKNSNLFRHTEILNPNNLENEIKSFSNIIKYNQSNIAILKMSSQIQ